MSSDEMRQYQQQQQQRSEKKILWIFIEAHAKKQNTPHSRPSGPLIVPPVPRPARPFTMLSFYRTQVIFRPIFCELAHPLATSPTPTALNEEKMQIITQVLVLPGNSSLVVLLVFSCVFFFLSVFFLCFFPPVLAVYLFFVFPALFPCNLQVSLCKSLRDLWPDSGPA